jgi:hypothetical protein
MRGNGVMKIKRFSILAWAFLGILMATSCQAGELHRDFPAEIDPGGIYVFYSHGAIVEGGNPMPKHPKWGVYDFPAIKRELVDSDFDLIAWHRPENTKPAEYAETLADQVRQLLDAGVEPNRITTLGFSRGGYISALASSKLENDELNVVLLAACGRWVKNSPEVRLYGNLLSIYETSDSTGSCKKLAQNSPGLKSFEEISISTDLSHGALYRPIEEWVKPVKDWIHDKARSE